MSEGKVQITIRVSKEVADQIGERAKVAGASRAAVASRLVAEAVAMPASEPDSHSPRPGHLNASLERIEEKLGRLVQPPQPAPLISDFRPLSEESLTRALMALRDGQAAHAGQMRRLLAKAVTVLLVHGGKADVARARTWVQKYMGLKPSRDDVSKTVCLDREAQRNAA